MALNSIESACTQLLEKEDLIIPPEIKERLKKDTVAVAVYEDRPKIMIYSLKELVLSEIVPVLSDLGFKVLNEVSFFVKDEGKEIFIDKLNIEAENREKLKLHKRNIKTLTEHALTKKIVDHCKLFSLAYKENFDIREILFVRTFLSYTDQLVAAFNKDKMIDTVVKYSDITRAFSDYFKTKFDPEFKGDRKAVLKEYEKKIEEGFKRVLHVNEDRVLKLFFKVLQSTVRTNYFLKKPAISIKVELSSLKQHLKGIQPSMEIFVYNQRFNGAHLRMGKVSRGGIRWSDRHEDFRTEIKSLMIAQEGKNAVIIPKGAKGGLVIYKNRDEVTKEEFKKHYITFINSLLDLVDNKVGNEIVRDERVVAYDGEDPYFVVAADRGTSSMSDVANEISLKRGYWLKDAFASGGSYGYHHKKLGITAKGALKSAERFFMERGLDIYEDEITVVGIGSMKGDVFGNGMLLSDKFKLLGAISHNEVFIDPSPDPATSFQERKRLFENALPWGDYDKKKISKGGGVFKRDEKEIRISKEIKNLLGVDRDLLSGEELAKELLKLEVDMIYLGGVGTYFKASEEENISIGDKANEFVRVDAKEIKAFCVCEGGNLGFTQKARMEYAKKGGRINLDSIDNSAGVNISDHEVNLKILLNSLVEKGVLKEEEKNETLLKLTDQVVNSVLWTNYFQPLAVSLDEIRSKKSKEAFIRTIRVLEENLEFFDRRDFKIPQDNEIEEIVNEEGALIRPVLSVLLLYSKIFLKNILNESDLIEKESAFEKFLLKYFPKSFASVYEDEIKEHHLKKEIASMMIANEIINFAGSSFICDFKREEKERFLLKVKSYLISNDLFRANDARYELYRSENKRNSLEIYPLLLEIEEAISYNLVWMMKGLYEKEISYAYILEHQHAIDSLLSEIDIEKTVVAKGNEKINDFFSRLNYLKLVTGIIIIYKSEASDFKEIGKLFYTLIGELRIIDIMKMIERAEAKSDTEKSLREQLSEMIEILMIELTRDVLRFKRKGESEREAVYGYFKEKDFSLEEFVSKTDLLKREKKISLTELSVLINSLFLL